MTKKRPLGKLASLPHNPSMRSKPRLAARVPDHLALPGEITGKPVVVGTRRPRPHGHTYTARTDQRLAAGVTDRDSRDVATYGNAASVGRWTNVDTDICGHAVPGDGKCRHYSHAVPSPVIDRQADRKPPRRKRAKAATPRQGPLCGTCFTQHAGACW